ncbi:MAG TPA: hypothetical protein VGN12_06865 [Pirellulales bacterium]|jgi:hypothetical protein
MNHVANHFRLRLIATLCAILGLLGTHAAATVISPNLPPGSKYELLFVTLDSTAATSTNIATYNAFAAAEAQLSPALKTLPPSVQWHAVASTNSVNAIVNAQDNDIPVYNTRGVLVATALSGLYDSGLTSPVQFNQFGNSETTLVWTGSNGLGGVVSNGQMGNDNDVAQGLSSAVNTSWIFNQNTTQSVNSFPIYALSSPITVPTPEPSTVAILGSGLLIPIGHYFLRWRRWHRKPTGQ